MLTIDLLIENDERLSEDFKEKRKIFTIKRLEEKLGEGNGDIEIRSITINELFDIEKKAKIQSNKVGDMYTIAKMIVAKGLVSPNIKSEELLKAKGCVKATDLIDKIFKPMEINEIADEITKLSDLDNNNESTLVEKIKN